MNNKMRIVAGLFVIMMVLGIAGCADGVGTPEKIISGGYIPREITNLDNGGKFDASALTPHESEALPLDKLEGFWVYEGIANEGDSVVSGNKEAAVVTDKTIMLNEGKIECLPRSIDIRPYSPTDSLIAQGFGYGSAVFQEIDDEASDLGIYTSGTLWSFPYAGNGFICATSGNTIALGFVDSEAELTQHGTITDKEDNVLSECKLTEVDYEVSLNGDRLTLSYGDVSATYVQDSIAWDGMHKSLWFGEPLYESNRQLKILGESPRGLLNEGFNLDCDMNEMMASCSISTEFTLKTPGGATLRAKVVNPYEKTVPVGYSKICWYEHEGSASGNITIGMPSYVHEEFGVTPYADVYNAYELPYEQSENLLCYKVSYHHIITSITGWGEGYDTGDTLLESEHSCDIRLSFDNNVLSSVSVGDSVYLNAGLQDNIAHDDLDELKPSVYREVTEQRDEILDELKKAFKEAGVDAAINEKTGEVVMDNNVLFETGSYELGAEGQEYLSKVFSVYASVILDDKYSHVLKEVSFEGNTDSDGESEFNMRLSENRAQAVMAYCSEVVDDNQRSAFDKLAACKGYGESDLVYNESGQEDKAASRRVAIKFMLNVDKLKGREAPEAADDNSDDTSTPSESPSEASGVSSSEKASEKMSELEKFRGISNNLNQAWMLYEESESDGSIHVSVLLLSQDHSYCAYCDLKQDSSGVDGYYTFGKSSVKETAENVEAITVQYDEDRDTLDVIFKARGRDDMVSLKDPWGGMNDLSEFENANDAISLFEDILSP